MRIKPSEMPRSVVIRVVEFIFLAHSSWGEVLSGCNGVLIEDGFILEFPSELHYDLFILRWL